MLRKATLLFATVTGALPGTLFAEEATKSSIFDVLNMPRGVTSVSHQVYDLHMLMFWICVIIGIGVFGYMLWALVFHRKAAGHEPAQFHENIYAEVAWTVVPFFILIGMAWPATAALKHLYDTSESELDIQVTGYQWKWQYEYLGEGVKFISEIATPQDEIYNLDPKGVNYKQEVTKPLVLPIDTKIVFNVTSADVIHSWWVPDFAVKRDAIPGYNVETWTNIQEPGIYRGQCAELCGQDHAFMPVEVHAVTKEEFAVWLGERKEEAAAIAALTEKTFTLDELMDLGKTTYERSCAGCHGLDGKGLGAAFPAIDGSPVALGPRENHFDVIVNGVTGTAMQSFASQLSEADIAAVITYQRNAWSNSTGDIIQPIEIFNYKNGQ